MKRLFALILAVLMLGTVLTGCGNSEELIDDNIIEESFSTVQFDAFYYEEDLRMMTITETWDEEPVVTQTNNVAYMATPGETVKQTLESNYASDLDIIDENGTFLGWMLFEQSSVINEDGFEYTITQRADEKLYTTDEMMEVVVGEDITWFVAMWSDIDEAYYVENGFEI